MPPRPKKLETVPDLARRIRQLRESRNESQTRFAAALGTLPSAVSKWEAGKNRPNPEVFVRLSRLADGETKRFFLDQAGIGFKEEGVVDFSLTDGARRLRQRVSLVPDVSERPESQQELKAEVGSTSWDPDLLRFVIETIDSELKKRSRKLPSPKYAEMVVLFYELCQQTRKRDTAMVERLLKIA